MAGHHGPAAAAPPGPGSAGHRLPVAVRAAEQGYRVVIATGDSNRQVKALARNVQEKVREGGAEVLSVEGEEAGEWVLVDLGDIVVHVMQPSVRQYYNLEELWKTTPAQRRKAAGQAAAE